MIKCLKGNEVWSLSLVRFCSDPTTLDQPVTSSHHDSRNAQVDSLLQEFQDVFATPYELPPHRDYDHAIPLKPGAIPINAMPYKYSPQHKTKIERQVTELLANGLITHSTSPFASPVLLVQKKDGSWRFCVDFRKLNELTIKNRFPMPIVEEILEELAGTKFFSKLDLHSGFHHVRVQPGDEYKTAFKTHHGHYEFKVMPFGLTNAPATFQCIMNALLAPFLRKFTLVFMDDILVYSSSWEQHCDHLRQVLTKLREHKLFVKRSKCSFAQTQLEYLGHIISSQGVATDPKKTAAMECWPVPQTVTDLRGFLGLTGYYRRFVRGYGILAKSLTNLLKKKQFKWSEEAEIAFQQLKKAMTSTPVLALPDFNLPFVVETDACDSGIGAVLMQNDRPIAFLSKALSEAHKTLSIYEKEFLALIMAVERWQPYLQRQQFIIRTDHKSLCFLEDQTLHSELQRKAMTRLMGLQFEIIYKKGKENTAADALSRVDHLMTIQSVSKIQPIWIQEVSNSYATDPNAQTLLAQLAIHSPNEQGYSLHDGIIRLGSQIWIAENSALRTKLIAALHASALGGHSGIQPTYQRLKRVFYWKGMKADVESFIRQCATCQQAKHELIHPAGLLQPLPIPDGVWQDLTMDFIEGLPKSEGHDTILVVVDRFSKYAHFMSL